MRGNGFCGFNSLSYSLTGNQQSYEEIINDCANVFVNVPDLFRTRTNFGARLDSSLSITEYVAYMRAAIDRVHRGLSVDSDAWCEDAHFAAIAVLYDIAIFNYSTAAHQWYSFNENATRVYICLLSLPGHTDVLQKLLQDTRPDIPCSVMSQAVSRESMNWPADASLALQRQFDFHYVWDWPLNFHGVEVLNRALVELPQPAEDVGTNESLQQPLVAVTQQNEDVSIDERPQQPRKTMTEEAVFSCSFANCSFSSTNFRALRMHKSRCHMGKIECEKSDQSSTETAFSCCFAGCNYSGSNARALQMHKNRCHLDKPGKSKNKGKQKDSGTSVTTVQPAEDVTADRLTCYSKTGWYCNVTGCSWGPVWTLAALEAHTEQRHKQSKQVKDVHPQKNTEMAGATKGRSTEKPMATPDTEFTNVTLRRSSRIAAKLENMSVTATVHKDKEPVRRKAATLQKKSVRHTNKRRLLDEKPLKQNTSTKTMCMDDGKMEPEAAAKMQSTNQQNNRKGIKIYTERSGTTLKRYLEKKFVRKMAALKKNFAPLKLREQNDPLYEKLKDHHDSLLISITNTTTEKLSAEVEQVVQDTAVMDDCSRPFPVSYTHLTLPTIYSV